MEKKTAAILMLALLGAVAVTAGGVYAMDRQSYSGQNATYGHGMGPGMMGGRGGSPGGMMGGGYAWSAMHEYMQNYSQVYMPYMMHQFAQNYSHLYLWNYCNSTGAA